MNHGSGRPKVLVLCDHYPPAARAGGAARSVGAIVAMEAKASEILVITRDRDLGAALKFSTEKLAGVDDLAPEAQIVREGSIGSLLAILRALACRRFDVVYLNSLFSPVFTLWPIALILARVGRGRRILLAPRGETARSALSIRPVRKRLALRLLRPAARHLRVVWHASSEFEAQSIADCFPGAAGNIVIQADPAVCPAGPSGGSSGQLTVAFVGRMVPVKNFELVARAAVTMTMPITILVAGAIEDKTYWERCQAILTDAPDNVSVRILEHLDHAAVRMMLSGADAMVLPTRGENFGHAIAEALSVGCPVAIPDTTIWSSVVGRCGGFLIDSDDPSSLTDALMALSSMPRAEKLAMRARVAATYADWWNRSQAEQGPLFLLE